MEPRNDKELLDTLIDRIQTFGRHLKTEIDVVSLHETDPIAHKWKVTYKCCVVRETAAWKFVDISQQALSLSGLEMIAGARILTRATIEAVSVLCHINAKLKSVVSGNLDFFQFQDDIDKIYAGSRVNTEAISTINVLTLIKAADKTYSGLSDLYERLSESAHPSWESLTYSYARTDYENMITYFSNFLKTKYGWEHLSAISACAGIFEIEYNDGWKEAFEALEGWLNENDALLESRREIISQKNI